MRDIQFLEANGDRSNVPNVAIVITDGESNVNASQTIPQAELAHAQGIYIYSIGISDAVNIEELAGISSWPHQLNQQYWTSPDFTQLGEIIDTVSESVCPPAPG